MLTSLQAASMCCHGSLKLDKVCRTEQRSDCVANRSTVVVDDEVEVTGSLIDAANVAG